MSQHAPWLNSLLFLLIGVWALVRKQPVRRDEIGGVSVVIQDPGAVDKFLRLWDKFQFCVLRVAGACMAAAALRHLIQK